MATLPSESLAVAEKETVAGSRYDAPFTGAVNETCGGEFATTVTFTGAEVVAAPPLSVARAVSAWLPGCTFGHETLNVGPFEEPIDERHPTRTDKRVRQKLRQSFQRVMSFEQHGHAQDSGPLCARRLRLGLTSARRLLAGVAYGRKLPLARCAIERRRWRAKSGSP